MVKYDFDKVVPRRGTDSSKYQAVPNDVLPMWVADMDFTSPAPIIEALQKRVEHGIFGYAMPPDTLKSVIVERMARLYNWDIQPEDIVYVSGVVTGFNAVMAAFADPGDNILMQTPVYPPFLMSPPNHKQIANAVDLVHHEDDDRLNYTIDFDAFEDAINDGTKMFLLCSPHNPVGRVWTREELTRMAKICEKHDILICSDEIHCDLVFDGHQHIPIASIAPEIAARTITLMAPSKTFNMPSLGFSFIIVQNEDLRKQLQERASLALGHINVLGLHAALAAYRDSGEWLEQVLAYLQSNRDYTTAYIDACFPDIRVTHPEGTYLSWLDCRNQMQPTASNGSSGGDWLEPYFMQTAHVALNNGALFGQSGEGFARLNFACPRSTLTEALERMRQAVTQ